MITVLGHAAGASIADAHDKRAIGRAGDAADRREERRAWPKAFFDVMLPMT